MTRQLLLFMLLCGLAINAKAQGGYIEYVPNPSPPPPQYYVPPQQHYNPPMQLMPPTRYLSPSNVDATPTVTIRTKFLILSALIDGKDVSQHYKNVSAGIAIYNVSDQSAPFMAIVLPGDNTNSNGKMLAVTQQEVPQTSTRAGKTLMTFAWEYVNSYDGKTGSATVTLTKEYRQEGTYVNCHIINKSVVSDFSGMITNN